MIDLDCANVYNIIIEHFVIALTLRYIMKCLITFAFEDKLIAFKCLVAYFMINLQ